MIDIGEQMPVPTDQISAKSKSALAIRHLMAAAHFSRLAGELEKAHLGESLSGFFDEECEYASACVLLATASLESNINEYLYELDREDVADNRRNGLLKKYQLALGMKGKDRFTDGEAVFLEADVLVRLRNALHHFKPEWVDDQKRHETLEANLRCRFDANPFYGNHGFFVPYGCMSYGCTQWAVGAALAFMLEFSRRIGSHFSFDQFADRLSPLRTADLRGAR
jgi:hypothetical protein